MTHEDFLHAAERNGVEKVEAYLAQHPDVDPSHELVRTAFVSASLKGKIKVVQTLINYGADVNATSNRGQLALQVAVLYQKNNAVKFLLANGADPNKKDEVGLSPLYAAANNNNLEAVELLLACGARCDERGKDGISVLQRACGSGATEIAELFLRMGLSPNETDNFQDGPLSFAARNGHFELVAILLANGANPNTMDHRNRTPLHAAARSRDCKVVDILIRYGADVNALDDSHDTALHCAGFYYNKTEQFVDVCELLLRHGADPFIPGQKGKSFFDLIPECSHGPALADPSYLSRLSHLSNMISNSLSLSTSSTQLVTYTTKAGEPTKQSSDTSSTSIINVIKVETFYEIILSNDSQSQEPRRLLMKLSSTETPPSRWRRLHSDCYKEALSQQQFTQMLSTNILPEVDKIIVGWNGKRQCTSENKIPYLSLYGYDIFRAVIEMLNRTALADIPTKVKSIDKIEELPHDKMPPWVAGSLVSKKQIERSFESLVRELNELIGLNSVKSDVVQLVNLVRFQEMRRKEGLRIPDQSLHMVFTGNPGTGKTTIARLLAEIYKSLNILSTGSFVEADRSQLVAAYLGQTAIKVRDVVESALGGVLFIDEAYSLVNDEQGHDQYGQEAVNTLLKLMEDHRGNLIVIVAGYTNLMGKFIRSNPGLQSRFNKYLHFDDYSPAELTEIFIRFAQDGDYKLSAEAVDKCDVIFQNLYKHRTERFGNASSLSW